MPARWLARDTQTVDAGEHVFVPVSYLLGPVLAGVLINSFVYGIVALHWIQYVLGRSRDGFMLRCAFKLEFFRRWFEAADARTRRGLVHWCFVIDSIHSGAALWLLWNATVTHFADVDSLFQIRWPISAVPLFVGKSLRLPPPLPLLT